MCVETQPAVQTALEAIGTQIKHGTISRRRSVSSDWSTLAAGQPSLNDSTASLQHLIDTAAADATLLMLPPGDYRISAALNLS